MKILKVRENKLKISLTAQEAAYYGFDGRKNASQKELCDIVNCIFAKQNETFRMDENVLVEVYAKMDGSYDIFVTNVEENRSILQASVIKESSFFHFDTKEELTFALGTLFFHESHTGRAPLVGRDDASYSGDANILTHSAGECTAISACAGERIGTPSFLPFGEEKLQKERRHSSLHIEHCRVYQYEYPTKTGVGYAYILELKPDAHCRLRAVSSIHEFGDELKNLDVDVLREHTQEIPSEELFG